MIRRYLLPANLDPEKRMAELHTLVVRRCRRGLVTTGWIQNFYPGERGWINQPGNTDARHRVWYAVVHTRRRESLL